MYAPAAVLLDSSGNSLEDITVIGFYDGVRIGSDSNAKEDVLINVIGDTTAHIQAPTPVNAIHIYNSNTVHDIVIKGVSNSQQNGTYTIQDDQTSLHLSDAFIAMYVAGKEIGPGYVRFTTSPNAPTWAVGNNFPTNNPTGNACTRGSLYSCIGGTSSCQSKALWGCALNSGGTLQWIPIM